MAIAALLRLGAAVAAIAGVAWQWKRPKLCDASKKYDVIVVGGGVMGVWSAIAAKRHGSHVCLLEQYDAGHRHGSSHGDGRIYRFAYQEELYVDMMNVSLVDWRALDGFAGGVLAETGGVSLYGGETNANYDSHGSRESLAALYAKKGLAHETLGADDLERRFPQFRPADRATLALFQPNFGVLFASPAVKSAWRYAATLGVRASPWTPVARVASTDGGAAVTTRDGRVFRAGAVVVAPGAWLTARSREWFGLDIPTEITAETVSYFAPRDADAVPHGYAAMPVFISDVDNGLGPYGYYGLPIVDVPGVKVSAHHVGFELAVDGSEDRPLAVNGNGSTPDREAAAADRSAARRPCRAFWTGETIACGRRGHRRRQQEVRRGVLPAPGPRAVPQRPLPLHVDAGPGLRHRHRPGLPERRPRRRRLGPRLQDGAGHRRGRGRARARPGPPLRPVALQDRPAGAPGRRRRRAAAVKGFYTRSRATSRTSSSATSLGWKSPDSTTTFSTWRFEMPILMTDQISPKPLGALAT